MNLRLLALWTMVSAQVFAAEPAKQVVPAAPAALPRAEEIAHLAVYPPAVKLRGLDDAVQMIVTAVLKDGAEVDVTGDSQISSTLGAGLKFSTTGRVAPLANGNGQITVAFAGREVSICGTPLSRDPQHPTTTRILARSPLGFGAVAVCCSHFVELGGSAGTERGGFAAR